MKKVEKEAIKKLICWLDDEDMRDNLKGKRLIEYIAEHFEVTDKSICKSTAPVAKQT